jgi:hypothetical protein
MKIIKSLLLLSLVGLFVTACERREESHEDIVKADLLLIIDSLGSPCEQVLEYKATEELAYTVNCESGDSYLISVNPQGRVDVQNKE